MIFRILFIFISIWISFPGPASAQYADLDAVEDCYINDGSGCNSLLEQVVQKEVSKSATAAMAYYEASSPLYRHGYLDEALQLLYKAQSLFPKGGDRFTLAKIQNGFIGVYLYLGKLDSAMKYADANVAMLFGAEDTTRGARALVTRGQIYKEFGNYPKALDDYLQATRMFSSANDSYMVARTQAELATLSAMNQDLNKAGFYNRAAAAYFKKTNHLKDYAYAILNRANDLNFVGYADSALPLLQEALSIFEDKGELYLQMNTEAQLGRAYSILNKTGLALDHFRKANELDAGGVYLAQSAYNHEMMSRIFRGEKELDSALVHAQQAVAYSKEIGINEEFGNALLELSVVYEERREFEKALDFEKQFHEVQDSLFSLEKSKKLLELKEAYEDELKNERLKSQDAEINLLAARSRVQRLRNIALGIGLALTLIIALLVINRQRTRMKLNRRLAEKKEQLHQAQLNEKEAVEKQLRSELDHKKRELTSQALLIAEKNELLRSFKEELRTISQNGNGSGNNEMNKLAHKIERAENTSEDWDKFMRIFEEVHPDFLQKMGAKFQELTSNDLRLVALMRMNLSNKEIASILHISDDGLKKARYRLRKRLSLPSEENMQEFLMQEA